MGRGRIRLKNPTKEEIRSHRLLLKGRMQNKKPQLRYQSKSSAIKAHRNADYASPLSH